MVKNFGKQNEKPMENFQKRRNVIWQISKGWLWLVQNHRLRGSEQGWKAGDPLGGTATIQSKKWQQQREGGFWILRSSAEELPLAHRGSPQGRWAFGHLFYLEHVLFEELKRSKTTAHVQGLRYSMYLWIARTLSNLPECVCNPACIHSLPDHQW